MRLWRSEVLYAVQFHLSIFFGDLTSALDWALTSEALDSRCRQICVHAQSDAGQMARVGDALANWGVRAHGCMPL